ncbi:MAG: carboxypeptidase-like regulatory domain-containing protein [Candidatus Sedimenticola sp. (ex Thyasira tokunagai)]
MKLLVGILSFLLGLYWSTASFGAVLSGVVSDEIGGLDEVEVMLIDAASGVVVDRYYTDSTGAYQFTLKPGNYKLGATKEEYPTIWIKGVSVGDKDVAADIEMRLNPYSSEGEDVADEDDCE